MSSLAPKGPRHISPGQSAAPPWGMAASVPKPCKGDTHRRVDGFALSGLVPHDRFGTQGDGDARTTRIALPWAGMFGPFGAGIDNL